MKQQRFADTQGWQGRIAANSHSTGGLGSQQPFSPLAKARFAWLVSCHMLLNRFWNLRPQPDLGLRGGGCKLNNLSRILCFLSSESHVHLVLPDCQRSMRASRAFTILEVVVVMTIIGTLSAMAVPEFQAVMEAARTTRAIGDLRTLQIEISQHELLRGTLPNNLSELSKPDLVDPWGNPYKYLNFDYAKKSNKWGGTEEGTEKPRKDRFLVPINSRYDLYSVGKDGETKEDLSANESVDDIVRANDGAYLGLASLF